jgi:DNA polymerase-3 subunit epsilon
MNNVEILNRLLSHQPVKTADLPRDQRGIYGLIDHTGHLRYIGYTTKEAENFRKRIHQRHRTGSETHSQYFSKIYNCGRMYRNRLTQQAHPDAKIAKDLRSAFIAEHCRAVYVPLDLG